MPDEPDPGSARLAREAEGYYELQLYEEALQRAASLLSHPPFRKFAMSMRAECLRCLEHWGEAAAAFESILESEPENIAAYVGLGWCRKRNGELGLAVESMERLVATHPGEAIGHFNLACYLALTGERERPLGLLRQAVATEESYRDLARKEEDFSSLRQDPEFRRIVRCQEDIHYHDQET